MAEPEPEPAFLRCVERLEALILAETRALKSFRASDFETFNQRKAHALLELSQAAQNTPAHVIADAQPRIDQLRRALADNAEALSQHLHAMQDITRLIVESVRESESDGTYSIKGLGRR